MLQSIRVLCLCAMTFVMASCGGGSNSGTIPAADLDQPAVARRPGDAQSAGGRAPRFIATQLPSGFVPSAMMANGKIPGSVGRDAAVFERGRLTDLGTFGSEFAVATSVNSRGDAVGFSTSGPLGGVEITGRALFFLGGMIRQLQGLSGADFSDARAIDEAGRIYGGSGSKDNLSGPRTLTLVQFSRYGAATTISPSFAFNDESDDAVISINRKGFFTVTRAGEGNAEFPNRGYIGFDSTASPVLNFGESNAADLNDRNTVVGTVAPLTAPDQLRGYVHDFRGTTRFLSFLPLGIDNRGRIVGSRTTQSTTSVMVESKGVAHDLNALLGSPLAVTFLLHGLSDRGAFLVQANHAYYLIERRDDDDY